MFRKSQSISINTIIIAAIALAVLVVLFVVFTGRFKIFSEGVKESSLSCDSACKSVGHLSGNPESGGVTQNCGGSNIKIFGRFEGMTEDKMCCCAPKPP
ncbi:MAG: hypothetical protein Q8R04_06950 [Nanoarchaeota archaeon]|nr:hypothetical protein [Nanoarchaeota archaeon]